MAKFDGVAGHADDAFDQALAIVRGIKHDDFAAFRVVPLGDLEGCDGDCQIICGFVYINAVPLKTRWFHRPGGHIVPISERRADREKNQRQDDQGADLFFPEFLGAGTESSSFHGYWTARAGNRSRFSPKLRICRKCTLPSQSAFRRTGTDWRRQSNCAKRESVTAITSDPVTTATMPWFLMKTLNRGLP